VFALAQRKVTLFAPKAALRHLKPAQNFCFPTGWVSYGGSCSLSNVVIWQRVEVTSVFVKKVVRFSKRLPPRFLATSDAPAAG